MLEAFNSGHDIHTATAAKINKISLEEVTSDMRRKAKLPISELFTDFSAARILLSGLPSL